MNKIKFVKLVCFGYEYTYSAQAVTSNIAEEFNSPAGKNYSHIMCVAHIMWYYVSNHLTSVYN